MSGFFTSDVGFTDPMTSVGDIMYRNGVNTTDRLGVGTSGQVLTSQTGGALSWAEGVQSILDTNGQIITYNSEESPPYIALNVGGAGELLYVSAGLPAWSGTSLTWDGSQLGVGTNSPGYQVEITDDIKIGDQLRMATTGDDFIFEGRGSATVEVKQATTNVLFMSRTQGYNVPSDKTMGISATSTAINREIYIGREDATTFNFQTVTDTYAGLLSGHIDVRSQNATDVTATFQAAAGQTAKVTEWKNSGGTVVASMDDTGLLQVADGKGIVALTADASDTDNIGICGGGALDQNRGAFFDMAGNEHSTRPGSCEVYAGDVAGGEIRLHTRRTRRMTIDDAGNVGIAASDPVSLTEIRGPEGAGAAAAGVLTLSTVELTVVDNDVLGQLNFQAPKESSGGDAILVGASIWGEAEDTFSAGTNSTALIFATATSATATEKMRLDSNGMLGIGTNDPDDLLHVSGGNALVSIRIENTDTTIADEQEVSSIEFEHQDSTNAGVSNRIVSIGDGTGGNTHLGFFAGAGGAANEIIRFEREGYINLLASLTTDTAPNDDTTPKKFSIQKLASAPTNAAYIAFSNNPGTDTFYLVMEEA